jgi:pimeloyl-ACP methyl ester carboxylesterase
MGLTAAPASIRGADDVVEVLVRFVDEVAGTGAVLVAGHSAGAHYARGIAARLGGRIAGLALVCPLLSSAGETPEHRAVVPSDELGDEAFRAYFVVQTPEMLDRYLRYVAPAVTLADQGAIRRIGQRWELSSSEDLAYDGPTLVIAGRQDSVVGYDAAMGLVERLSQATLAVVDGAGHALPHEQPELLAVLLTDWLNRAARQ